MSLVVKSNTVSDISQTFVYERGHRNVLDFSFLWAETFPIPPHAIMALTALVLGSVQMVTSKGTALHKVMGYIWVGLMFGTAVTAMFIYELKIWGRFSPIHLLVPVVLVSLWLGIRAARHRDIRRHRKIMLSLFFLALVLTGLFTLLPGRVMQQVLLGGG